MGREDFSISRHDADGAAVVAPAGEVDLETVHGLRDVLFDAARTVPRVVLDLREVTFMDSSGLRLLVELQQQSQRDGYALAVVRGPASLDRLLDVTGLRDRLEVHDDPGQAVRGGKPGG